MPQGGVEGDDADLSDFRSQILRRTSIGGGGGGGAAALSRVSSKISILMSLQRTSRANLLVSREASVESNAGGRRYVQFLGVQSPPLSQLHVYDVIPGL